jgi:cytochrome c oxidase subunit III
MNTEAHQLSETGAGGHVHRDPVGARTGMWLFLFTELLLFGGLFIIYAVYRGEYTEGFHEAAHHLNVWLGVTNTVVLLTSSLTMVLGVSALQRNQRGLAQLYLISTLLLAFTFLLIKFFEWNAKYHHGIFPGMDSLHALPHGEGLFYNLYFMMTGLHGIHVIIGMAVMTVVYNRIQSGTITKENQGILEYTGLYWHLVDLIWIFLLPLFYLTN